MDRMMAIKVGSIRPKKYFPSEIGSICRALLLSEFGDGFEVGDTIMVVVRDIGTSSVFVFVATPLLSKSVASDTVSEIVEVVVAVGRPLSSTKTSVTWPI